MKSYKNGDASKNMLLDIQTRLVQIPVDFREQVCIECNYSSPTYYRKMKSSEKAVGGRPVSVLSNAEKEKYISTLDQTLLEFRQYYMDKYGKLLKQGC